MGVITDVSYFACLWRETLVGRLLVLREAIRLFLIYCHDPKCFTKIKQKEYFRFLSVFSHQTKRPK